MRIAALQTVLRVRVEGTSASVLEAELPTRWARCLGEPDPAAVTAPDLVLTLDDPATLASTLQASTQRITRSLITAQAGRLLMLHAGAVSHPATGASLVFVAPGGTGKTTLARVLGSRLGYLTDETVGIDRAGRIHAYPKPLSVKQGSGAPKDEIGPDTLGLGQAHPAPWVAQVVLLTRKGGPATPDVEELDPLSAVAAMAPESSSLSSLRQPLGWVRELIRATAPVQRWRYSEASTLEPLAWRILDGAERRSPALLPMVQATSSLGESRRNPSEATVDRRTLVDEITEGGRTLVLGDSSVTLLGEVASAVLDLVRPSLPLDHLVTSLTERFGEPEGDPTAQVLSVIAQLEQRGIVTISDPTSNAQ